MTSAQAIAPASPNARDTSSGRPLWDFVREAGLQSLVVATSKDPNAKIIVLLVSPDSGRTVLAIKAPTTATAQLAVEREMRVLEEIRRHRLGGVRETVPRVVHVVAFDQYRAAVTTALPGMPMSTTYSRRRQTGVPERVERDFAAVSAWIAELQRDTAQDRAPLEMDDGVSARLQVRFAGDALLRADIDNLGQIHTRLRRNRVPRTVVHGDFWFGNILMSNGDVSGVVDWEAGVTCGEPVRDLVRFANMYALYLDRRTRAGRRVPGHPGLRAAPRGPGLEYALDGTGWFPAKYRSFLADGLARLGAAPESWRDAALAGIAEVAAVTDHDDFARLHLELFRRLTSQGSRG